MVAPVLLVADDLALIAAVKRVLGREGHEHVLATSSADATVAFSTNGAAVLLLQPSVEGDRGGVVLEELQALPGGATLPVVLLGDTVPGFDLPVEPLPVDPQHLAGTVRLALSGSPPAVPADAAPAAPAEDSLSQRLFGDLPALEDALHEEVEREALASVESALARDLELEALEAEVLAEAQRRRQSREQASTAPAVAPGADDEAPVAPDAAEQVAQALSRAEQMVLESRAVAEAHRRADEAEARRAASELEAATRSAEHAESLVRREREQRAALEDELERLRARLDDVERNTTSERTTLSRSVEAERARAFEKELELKHELAQLLTRLEATSDELAHARATLTETLAEKDHHAEQLRKKDERIAELTRQREERLVELNRQQGDTIAELTRRADERLKEVRAELEAAKAERDELAARLSENATRVGALEEVIAERDAAHATALAELRRSHAQDVEDVRREAEQRRAATRSMASEREELLAAHAAELEELRRTHAQAMEAREATVRGLEEQAAHAREAAKKRYELPLAEVRRQLAEARAELTHGRHASVRVKELEAQLTADGAELGRARARITELEEQLAHSTRENELVEQSFTEAELARQTSDEAREQLESRVAGLTRDAAAAAAERTRLEGELDDVRRQLAASREEGERLRARVDGLAEEREELAARVTQLSGTVAELTARLEGSEAARKGAEERVEALEARATMPLSLPGRTAYGVPRMDTVDLEGLARLVAQLAVARVDARLELGASGGTRTLVLRRGTIVAAASTVPTETLIERARKDGLLDARQDAELRMFRSAELDDQLAALRGRGLVRDEEVVPLLQRYTEQVALDALSEDTTTYRLDDDGGDPGLPAAATPEGVLPLLAQALRRALPPEQLLVRLGGLDAVLAPTDSELDARALGFSERERRLLALAGEGCTVEAAVREVALKPEQAFRALVLARLLGLVDVKAPAAPPRVPRGDIDVSRLDAKFTEVQDADYFSILGLPRTAGSDDVRRAWETLSQEFNPLRFTGAKDPGLQQRAHVVYDLLEEAARALQDDARRAEYARHLVD